MAKTLTAYVEESVFNGQFTELKIHGYNNEVFQMKGDCRIDRGEFVNLAYYEAGSRLEKGSEIKIRGITHYKILDPKNPEVVLHSGSIY